MSYLLTPEMTIPLTWNLVQRFFMIETFKKCPEVPTSFPNFDDISTTFESNYWFTRKSLFSENFVLCREKFFLVVFDKPNVFKLFYSNMSSTFNIYKELNSIHSFCKIWRNLTPQNFFFVKMCLIGIKPDSQNLRPLKLSFFII